VSENQVALTSVFDLRPLTSKTREFNRFARGVAVIMGFVGAALLVIGVLVVVSSGPAAWTALLPFGEAGAFFLGLSTWAALVRGGKPAALLSIGDTGVLLEWAGGPRNHLDWRRRAFRWDIQRTHDLSESFLSPRLRPSSPMRKEAAELLLAYAKRQRLKVVRSRWSSRFGQSGPLWVLKPGQFES
jgi:hypothetical protein